MKNTFLEGDWASKKGKREPLNQADYVLKVSEDDILVRFLSGNTMVVPKSRAKNLDGWDTYWSWFKAADWTLFKFKGRKLLKMCVIDFQALRGK